MDNVNWSNWETKLIYDHIFTLRDYNFIRDMINYNDKTKSYLSSLLKLSVYNLIFRADANEVIKKANQFGLHQDNLLHKAFEGHVYEYKVCAMMLISIEVMTRVNFDEIADVLFPDISA